MTRSTRRSSGLRRDGRVIASTSVADRAVTAAAVATARWNCNRLTGRHLPAAVEAPQEYGRRGTASPSTAGLSVGVRVRVTDLKLVPGVPERRSRAVVI